MRDDCEINAEYIKKIDYMTFLYSYDRQDARVARVTQQEVESSRPTIEVIQSFLLAKWEYSASIIPRKTGVITLSKHSFEGVPCPLIAIVI